MTNVNARIDHILGEALALSPDERSALVIALLDSLEGEDEARIGKAWTDEIRLRKNALRSGTAVAMPWSEVRERISAL